MSSEKQSILVVSEDARLCAAVRQEFVEGTGGPRVASVASFAAARRILEEDLPAVILLEESAVRAEADGPRDAAPRLDTAVSKLAEYAPVVVIGSEERRAELSELIHAGAAEYVKRDEGSLPSAVGLIRNRLYPAQDPAAVAGDPLEVALEDFGEVLRHELNNPLTGILGNAELLLAELHRKNDGKLPRGGEQRLQTIAALAVRLRETVRRLSQEWETRQHPAH
jgi:signal transduction histidine kinase